MLLTSGLEFELQIRLAASNVNQLGAKKKKREGGAFTQFTQPPFPFGRPAPPRWSLCPLCFIFFLLDVYVGGKWSKL